MSAGAGAPTRSAQERAALAAELRTTFLFEALTPEQLGFLAESGAMVTFRAGDPVFVEGEPATCFFVLLEGEVRLTRTVRGGGVVELNRTSHRGSYAGATQAYLQNAPKTYGAGMDAVTDARLFSIPAQDFALAIRTWFPMAMHLLEGLFFGMRASETMVSQRERINALGTLTAGLTHELNNPAASAVRAVADLRTRVAAMREKLSWLARREIEPEHLYKLTDLQTKAIERAANPPRLTAIEASDREDEMGDWLEGRGVNGAWDLAPIFVAAGLDTDWAQEVADSVQPELVESSLRWLGYTVETEQLMAEIEDSVTRISTLVGAARQYSQLDRTPYQPVDVHAGLDATLVMLGGKLRAGEMGITVVKDYAEDLPRVPGYAAELNQVWTNMIDNAVQAMGGEGTLTLRTRLDGESVLVEIGDDGPGIPAEARSRVFEPFFTTKAVGQGTGLGLDISYRIVVNRHRGDIMVDSRPGDTRFQVRLPVQEPSLGVRAAVDPSAGRSDEPAG